MTKTVGTCSLCGGPVTVPTTWLGTEPPTPSCSRCGAVPKNAHGATIQMERPKIGESGQVLQQLNEG